MSYWLRDVDFGDKFIIRIAEDKRFGVPIFETLGGRSRCPAEPGTIWRDAGMSGVMTSMPGQRLDNFLNRPVECLDGSR